MFDWLLLVALAGVAAPTPQQASTPPFQEEVVVTGVLVRESRSDLPASATVIEAEEIRERQASQVLDVLRTVPGLHIDSGGTRGSLSSLYIRGAEANHTVVMIDGVRVNDPTNARGGSCDFSLLSTENIERTEVVRGTLPAQWNTNAPAGADTSQTNPNGGTAVRLRFEGFRQLTAAGDQ